MVTAAYGNYNDAVLECGKEQEQTFITWDYDSGDSQGKSSEDQVKGYNDLLATQPRSVLALNHDVHPSTVYVFFYFHFLFFWSGWCSNFDCDFLETKFCLMYWRLIRRLGIAS